VNSGRNEIKEAPKKVSEYRWIRGEMLFTRTVKKDMTKIKRLTIIETARENRVIR
jgi:hypothetical protein